MIVTLVEDDPTVLELLAELLRMHKHETRPVLVGLRDTLPLVLDRLAETQGEVVLMDLGMPVPGVDILDAAMKDPRFGKTRFVVATASFDAPKGARPVLPPGVKLVSKPYDLPELLEALKP